MLLQQHNSLHNLPSKGPFLSSVRNRQFRLSCHAELGKGEHRGGDFILNTSALCQVSYLCILQESIFPFQTFFWALGAKAALELLRHEKNMCLPGIGASTRHWGKGYPGVVPTLPPLATYWCSIHLPVGLSRFKSQKPSEAVLWPSAYFCLFVSDSITPIFTLSSVSGENLDLLKVFLNILPPLTNSKEQEELMQQLTEFQVGEGSLFPVLILDPLLCNGRRLGNLDTVSRSVVNSWSMRDIEKDLVLEKKPDRLDLSLP